MKILLSAYSCDPESGSEERNGWYTAVNLAILGHHVWVLTHPHGRAAVEHALKIAAHPGLRILFINQPKWSAKLMKVESAWVFRYIVWQRQAYRVASRLDSDVHFDIVHHLTWGNFKAGSLLWRLGRPFILGPVGGGQVAPAPFRSYFKGAWGREALRSFLTTRLLYYIPQTCKTVRNASVVLATNRETMSVVEHLGARRVEYCLDCALPEDFIPTDFPKRTNSDQLTLVWVGKLTPNKALRLTLEALAQVSRSLRIRLQILGDGPQSQYLNHWLAQYGIQEQVDYLGQVSWSVVKQVMLESDILIFSSLRDSSGVQILEAMALGLPIIALDHQGARDMVTEYSGIKVPVTNPEETVGKMAESIEYLYHRPDIRAQMGREGWEWARKETWKTRAKRFDLLYRELAQRRVSVY